MDEPQRLVRHDVVEAPVLVGVDVEEVDRQAALAVDPLGDRLPIGIGQRRGDPRRPALVEQRRQARDETAATPARNQRSVDLDERHRAAIGRDHDRPVRGAGHGRPVQRGSPPRSIGAQRTVRARGSATTGADGRATGAGRGGHALAWSRCESSWRPTSFVAPPRRRQACYALAASLRAIGHDVVEVPLADGGEGTLDALGGPNRTTVVSNPLGDPVEADWRLAGRTAVIEMARASGLADRRRGRGERSGGGVHVRHR